MTSPVQLIDTPQAAQRALEAYHLAADDYANATNAIAEVRYALADMEQRLSDVEAEIVANGGWQGHEITAAATSALAKAQASFAIASHPRVQEAREAIREKKRELALHEGAQSEAANAMRGWRLQIEYVTSRNYREAAVEGRTPAEIQGSYRNGH